MRESSKPSESARRTAVAFRRGDPAAVEAVRRYVRRILGYRNMGLGPGELPDLEQQVMTEVWSAAAGSRFDATAGFWAFVGTVAARRSIDALRRARPALELPEALAAGGPTPLESVLAGERAALARRTLARLPAPCRELIELHAGRQLSYREIAPILGASEGALRVRMHRCVEKARRLLARSGHPAPAVPEARESGG